MSVVFISYAWEDVKVAERLHSSLEGLPVEVWRDRQDSVFGPFIEAVNDALRACSYFIWLASQASVKSFWVRKELYAALALLAESPRRHLMTLKLEECPMPPMLLAFAYADFEADPQGAIDTLLQFLRRDLNAPVMTSSRVRGSLPAPLQVASRFQLRSAALECLAREDFEDFLASRNWAWAAPEPPETKALASAGDISPYLLDTIVMKKRLNTLLDGPQGDEALTDLVEWLQRNRCDEFRRACSIRVLES